MATTRQVDRRYRRRLFSRGGMVLETLESCGVQLPVGYCDHEFQAVSRDVLAGGRRAISALLRKHQVIIHHRRVDPVREDVLLPGGSGWGLSAWTAGAKASANKRTMVRRFITKPY
jgi:hypothetical protein